MPKRKKPRTAGTAKPAGLKKWFFKAPNYLYRARLGFIFGNRFLMLEHRGRNTGRLYRTVLEVAGRNDVEWIVTAGFGPRSDWYRNLKVETFEAVWLGSRRHEDVSVRFLGHEEAGMVMGDYEKAHAKTARGIYKAIGVSYDGTDEGRAEMMRQIPMVGFAVRI